MDSKMNTTSFTRVHQRATKSLSHQRVSSSPLGFQRVSHSVLSSHSDHWRFQFSLVFTFGSGKIGGKLGCRLKIQGTFVCAHCLTVKCDLLKASVEVSSSMFFTRGCRDSRVPAAGKGLNLSSSRTFKFESVKSKSEDFWKRSIPLNLLASFLKIFDLYIQHFI